MKNWRIFLSTWSTDGGSMFMLFMLHNILLVCIVLGWDIILKESYFLVLGALLGLLKGEIHRNPNTSTTTTTKSTDITEAE